MKKTPLLLLGILLSSCGNAAEASSPEEPLSDTGSEATGSRSTITHNEGESFIVKTAPLYFDEAKDGDFLAVKKADLSYGYYEQHPQIIYMDMAIAMQFVNEEKRVESTVNNSSQTIVCENGSSFVIDANNNTILAKNIDYANIFSSKYGAINNLIDDDYAVEHISSEGSEMFGAQDVTFDLNAYNLDIVCHDGTVYTPFPIVNRMTFNWAYYSPVAWNGEAFYLLNLTSGSFDLNYWENSYNKAFFSGSNSTTPRAEYFADYNYKCLLFSLDYFYGFLDERFVPFEEYLDRNHSDIVTKLRSTDEEEYCDGLCYLMESIIGDCHTNAGTISSSFGTGSVGYHAYSSERSTSLSRDMQSYYDKFKQAGISSNVVRYSGSTAILSFTGFRHAQQHITRDNAASFAQGNKDSFALFYTAFEEIKTHPEVHSVVFDVTLNGGGDTNALVGMLGFMKREYQVISYDPLSKGYSNLTYRVDTNLDGKYDANDGYEGKYDFYILTSRGSFSCANSFPAIAKENNMAKIIGLQSAGGACTVDYTCTPDGKAYRISGILRGGKHSDPKSHYDSGVPVDHELDANHFYDDAYINQFISTIH